MSNPAIEDEVVMHKERLKNPTQDPPKGKFVRELSRFSATRVLGALLGLLRSYIIARWLGPQGFGTWQFIHIYDRYSAYAGLSTRPALNRRIPFLRGRNDLGGMQAVLNTSFTINFSGPIIYSLLVLSISFFLKDAFDAKALAVFAPVILLLTWLDYAKLLSMVTGLYSFRSRLELQHDILFTLLSVTLIFIGGLYGVIAGLGIATLISVIYAVRKLWSFCGFGIDWKVLWDLILTGLPLTANGFLHSVMTTMDKLLIAAMLDRETLGVYGVAFTGVTILTVMPVSLGQMVLVKFAEMEGRNVSKAQSLHVLNRTTTTVSCLFAPIVSAAVAYFPVVVAFLLPNFGGAIPSGKYLFASLFFLGLATPSTNWCMATGHFIPVLAIRLIAIIVEFVAIYLIIHNGGNLEFIALSVLCASAIFSISLISLCSSILGKPIMNGILSLCENLLPFLSILTVILIQNYYFHADIYAPGIPLVVYATLEFVVSLAVSIPVVYWGNRRTQFIELIWASVRSRLNKVSR